MFVDWAGATIPVYDRLTGQAWPAPLFVATLGASSYTWAEVVGEHGGAGHEVEGIARRTCARRDDERERARENRERASPDVLGHCPPFSAKTWRGLNNRTEAPQNTLFPQRDFRETGVNVNESD